MENNTIPTAIRRLLVITVTLLAVTILAAGANMYVTLAAPQRAVTVPTTVGFEGRLTDSSGSPVQDGTYNVTFTLYDVATGGTALWTEINKPVTTHSGLYSVQLGTTEALEPGDFDGPRWLGVTVGTGAEMTPRIPISSVPFALNAAQASGLQGRGVSANAPQDGQALVWDMSGSEWHPSTIDVEYPRRVSGFHIDDTVTVGSDLSSLENDVQFFNIRTFQHPPANGDTFTSSFVLQAGTYSLYLLGDTNLDRGKLDLYVDNVLQVSGQDWYSGAVIWNVIQHVSITVADDGYHTLKGVVNGKNTSSNNYYVVITKWWIAPASD